MISGNETEPQPDSASRFDNAAPMTEDFMGESVISNAEFIAGSLALDFLRNGNYNVSSGPINLSSSAQWGVFAAAVDAGSLTHLTDTRPHRFAGLTHKSVI